MFSKITQIKQSITDELEQAINQQKPVTPSVATIENHANLLNTETPSVDDVVADLGTGESNSDPNKPNENSKDSNKAKSSKNIETTKGSKASEASEVATGTSNTDSAPTNQKSRSAEGSSKNIASLQSPPSSQISSLAPSRAATPVTDKDDDKVIEAKLAKFAKYEAKYPQLLKAYKIEKKKNELVKIYEQVLAENTPCTSISEAKKFADFISGLKVTSEQQTRQINKLKSDYQNISQKLQNTQKELQSSQKEAKESVRLRTELTELSQKYKTLEQSTQKVELNEEQQVEIESLKTQLKSAEESRNNSFASQQKLRSQLEELSRRVSEVQIEKEVLLEKNKETEALNADLLKKVNSAPLDSAQSIKMHQHETQQHLDQLNALTEEKEKLEIEIESLGRRLIRENENSQIQLKSLKAQLENKNNKISKLEESVHTLNNKLKATKEKPTLVSQELPQSPQSPISPPVETSSRGSSADSAKANELLKKVNADNVNRIRKLMKAQQSLNNDMEALKQENERLRSVYIKEPESDDMKDKQAYLRNVLLGYMTRKDQRQFLLPVLATLLGLKESDVKTFSDSIA